MQLGTARNRAERTALEAQKRVLGRLADRGEWDVLDAIKAGHVTAGEIERLIDQHGIENYRTRLELRPQLEVPTLEAHMASWLETVERESTRKAYRQALPHLLDFEVDGDRLGDREWHRIPRHVIKDVKASLPHATNTIRLFMGAWSSFFTWAVEREASQAEEAGREPLIRDNPVRQAKAWSTIERTRHRFLSWEEFQRLLEVAPEPMRAQYATLVLAGLRIEEFMNLPPTHVHPPTHIHIGPWGTWAPKGYPRYKHGIRDVPIHRQGLLPALLEYQRVHAGTSTFFVNPGNGTAWSYSPFKDRMRKDVEAAGMRYGQWSRSSGKLERDREGVTAHTLRHTLASWLTQEDVQLMKVALILGHTEETVRDHYAHLLPGDLDQSLNRLSLAGILTASSAEPPEDG